jgi:hypothetical protein
MAKAKAGTEMESAQATAPIEEIGIFADCRASFLGTGITLKQGKPY